MRGRANLVVSEGVLDEPTAGDRRRMKNARRKAHARLREIDVARTAAVADAFRAEMAATVRSPSPLLTALLATFDLTLNDAVRRIGPQREWPRRPRLSGPKGYYPLHPHLLRHHIAGLHPAQISSHPLTGCRFERDNGDFLLLQFVDHSLELNARIGRVLIETRFGELRIEFMDTLPETILASCVGRMIEEIVDHVAWRGRGWRIRSAKDAEWPFLGQRLIVVTGSVSYRMPWAR
ncbi:hypothetical protein [Sphingomonas sp. UYEF23]|uniref:hypothetical protein n=1 Tax=Sphingomonas sp. UYEF23 TaxID=1756408 RepID=UPI003396D869